MAGLEGGAVRDGPLRSSPDASAETEGQNMRTAWCPRRDSNPCFQIENLGS